MDLWPHQQRGIEDTLSALSRGERRVLVTSPTGGGKTRMMFELARHYLEKSRKVVIYTNRRLLVQQTSRELIAAGHDHGIRAAGYEDERDHFLQLSSIQTEHSRVTRGGTWYLHEADLVLIDEAHLQTGKMVCTVVAAHIEHGADIVGFTATPLGLGAMYDVLVIAGTPSELRECGALVPAIHYGPDEPDLRKIKNYRLGEDLSEKQARQVMMVPGVFGRVWGNWRTYNPDGQPTILFGPDVAGSLWFAEQFAAKGVRAAHIDGQEVWIDGKAQRTTQEARDYVLAESKAGRCPVICNRFVLREGIDAPWLYCGVLATVFGALSSYLQAGGRLLRAHPSLEEVVVIDHGGNWWRHGSLNADREWSLDLTGSITAGLRADQMRQHPEKQPFACPKCHRIMHGTACPCGFVVGAKRSRLVVQVDGQLKEMSGAPFKPRRVSNKPNAAQLWERMYHRARSEKWDATFAQAEAMFAQENNWGWPSRELPFMPKEAIDFFRKVRDVPQERLIPKE